MSDAPIPPRATSIQRRLRIKTSDVLAGLALIISITSACISYQMWRSATRQLQLAELQIRPYVRYKPIFHQNGASDLTITTISENLSPIPANVIYDELKTWADGETTSAFLFNRTGDVLYQHRNGFSTVPDMPKELARRAISGKVQIMIGACVVYSSISPSDIRRWEVRALYSYEPRQELPAVQYLQEKEIPQTLNRCDTTGLRSEWLERKKQPAKP